MKFKTCLPSGCMICAVPKAGLSRQWVSSLAPRGAIIGRYERAEMMPSIEVAKKLAQAFEVTLDYLVSPSSWWMMLHHMQSISQVFT